MRRLGTDHVDLYYQHRAGPSVPIDMTSALRPAGPAPRRRRRAGPSGCRTAWHGGRVGP
ncbi:hypothetical protein AB0910_11190 [Streptomyces sp. NPDC047002]|uniref:hypothetical protein n=1 Tax=Streptomyces sp. NPDC047002 TaxID=3155475 RepID=UPI00345378B5